MRKKVLWLAVLALLLVCVSCARENGPAVNGNGELSVTVPVGFENVTISVHGNIFLAITKKDFQAAGFQFGDTVRVSFWQYNLEMPVCRDYGDVAEGENVCLMKDDKGCVTLAINGSSFAEKYGISEDKLPRVTITRIEKE